MNKTISNANPFYSEENEKSQKNLYNKIEFLEILNFFVSCIIHRLFSIVYLQ